MSRILARSAVLGGARGTRRAMRSALSTGLDHSSGRHPDHEVGDAVLDVAVEVLDLVRPEVDGTLYLFLVAPDLLHHSSRTRSSRPACSGSPRVFQMWACSATIVSVTFLAPIRIGNGSCTGEG